MALKTLRVSEKVKTSKQANPLMKWDKGVDVGAFVIEYLQEISKLLPQYADDTAAGAAGLDQGKMYLNSTTGALSFKL
jgi:hypothetical protein